MFLTREQVAELTGYRQPSRQIKRLQAMRLRYFERADGYPAVPAAQLEPAREAPRRRPNLEALKQSG